MRIIHIIYLFAVVATFMPSCLGGSDSPGSARHPPKPHGEDGEQNKVQDRLYQFRLRINSGDNSAALWQEFAKICFNASASKTNTTDRWVHYAYACCLYGTLGKSSLDKVHRGEMVVLAQTLAEMAWTNGLPCAGDILASMAEKSGNHGEAVKLRKMAASQGCVPALRKITAGSNHGTYPSKYFSNAEDEYYHSFLYMLLGAWAVEYVDINNPIISDIMVTLEVAKERNAKAIIKIAALDISAVNKFNEITQRYKRNEVIGWQDPYVSKEGKRP